MNISISKLKQGDLLETMRFSYCADKDNFTKAFNSIGLPIRGDADLVQLADWSNKGYDTGSRIKNSNNVVLRNFSIKDFVNDIKIRHNMVAKCTDIKFVA